MGCKKKKGAKALLTENDAVLSAPLVVPPELAAEVLRPTEPVNLGRVEQVHPAAHAVPENLQSVSIKNERTTIVTTNSVSYLTYLIRDYIVPGIPLQIPTEYRTWYDIYKVSFPL